MLEPLLRLQVVGQLVPDDGPEVGRVVRLEQVGQLVDDDVLDHAHRGLDEPPVEIEAILRRQSPRRFSAAKAPLNLSTLTSTACFVSSVAGGRISTEAPPSLK